MGGIPPLEDRFPRVALGTFPTPVEPLDFPDVPGELWVKRDDRTAERYGGNKVRKLEFILAEARRRGAGRLITAGALGSHHALATTLYGRELGFDVTLVLSPQPPDEKVRSVLRRLVALGAEIRCVPRLEFIPVGLSVGRLFYLPDRPFVVPPGGSSVRGVMGYVQAARELTEQIHAGEVPRPDWVHVACGTMGTAVGLAVGFAMAREPIQVSAVRVVAPVVAHRTALRRLVRATLRALGSKGEAPSVKEVMARIHLDKERLGSGYGRPTPEGGRATELFQEAGLALDPTYTAKAAAGFLHRVRRSPDDVHLFWQTLSHGLPEVEGSHTLPEGLPHPVRSALEG